MSVLTRKYPFQSSGSWVRDCLFYCLVVTLILALLQPFGFSSYSGNKWLVSLLFGAVTFFCCVAFHLLVFDPLLKKVRPWRIWHQALTVLGMVLFIGLCNFILFSLLFHIPFSGGVCLLVLYWTLLIGIIVTVLSTSVSYLRYLRNKLDALLEKSTGEQQGVVVTVHDTRVRGNDLSLPINDLLYIEAQKNNVAVYYLKDGKMQKAEVQSTLAAVLNDLDGYENVFQCHRSFVVNLNNISSAKGNSNGYTLELGGGLATVPVSRSFVPKLRSFIA